MLRIFAMTMGAKAFTMAVIALLVQQSGGSGQKHLPCLKKR